MNRQMWANAATQRNVAQLRADGVVILGPDAGSQACGEVGEGRMIEPEAALEAIVSFFRPKLLAGRRVLVTAGPTFEPIDPVRGMTNRSSGKMGFALARAAQQAGAEVRLIAGPVALPTPWGVEREDVETAQQMYDAVMHAVSDYDVFVAVAAVADWRVAHASEHKIKKTAAQAVPSLSFVENPDILATVARLPVPPYCVGFAAESGDLERNGEQKRIKQERPALDRQPRAGHVRPRRQRSRIVRRFGRHAAAARGQRRARRQAHRRNRAAPTRRKHHLVKTTADTSAA